MIPIASIQWLADKLLQRGQQKRVELKEKRDRVANYFDSIAATIEAMLKAFKEDKIPRIEGKRLEALLDNFDRTVHSIYDRKNEKDKKQVHKMLSDLYQTAESARNDDMMHYASGYFGDKGLVGYPSRTAFLEDLERIVGMYQGLAISLRAVALE